MLLTVIVKGIIFSSCYLLYYIDVVCVNFLMILVNWDVLNFVFKGYLGLPNTNIKWDLIIDYKIHIDLCYIQGLIFVSEIIEIQIEINKIRYGSLRMYKNHNQTQPKLWISNLLLIVKVMIREVWINYSVYNKRIIET